MGTRFKYEGDFEKGKKLRSFALNQLNILRDLMKFQGLTQNKRTVLMLSGEIIECKAIFNENFIKIIAPGADSIDYTPPPPPEDENEYIIFPLGLYVVECGKPIYLEASEELVEKMEECISNRGRPRWVFTGWGTMERLSDTRIKYTAPPPDEAGECCACKPTIEVFCSLDDTTPLELDNGAGASGEITVLGGYECSGIVIVGAGEETVMAPGGSREFSVSLPEKYCPYAWSLYGLGTLTPSPDKLTAMLEVPFLNPDCEPDPEVRVLCCEEIKSQVEVTIERSISIGYTTLNMRCKDEQTLTAIGPADPCYTWSMSGGGALEVAAGGRSALYTAPESNEGCEFSPVITLSYMGEEKDSISIAVNCYTGVAPATVVKTIHSCSEITYGSMYCLPDLPGQSYTPRTYIALTCATYLCDGTMHTQYYSPGHMSCVNWSSIGDGLGGCSDLGKWAAATCSPAQFLECCGERAPGSYDVRTPLMIEQGCCL